MIETFKQDTGNNLNILPSSKTTDLKQLDITYRYNSTVPYYNSNTIMTQPLIDKQFNPIEKIDSLPYESKQLDLSPTPLLPKPNTKSWVGKEYSDDKESRFKKFIKGLTEIINGENVSHEEKIIASDIIYQSYEKSDCQSDIYVIKHYGLLEYVEFLKKWFEFELGRDYYLIEKSYMVFPEMLQNLRPMDDSFTDYLLPHHLETKYRALLHNIIWKNVCYQFYIGDYKYVIFYNGLVLYKDEDNDYHINCGSVINSSINECYTTNFLYLTTLVQLPFETIKNFTQEIV